MGRAKPFSKLRTKNGECWQIECSGEVTGAGVVPYEDIPRLQMLNQC